MNSDKKSKVTKKESKSRSASASINNELTSNKDGKKKNNKVTNNSNVNQKQLSDYFNIKGSNKNKLDKDVSLFPEFPIDQPVSIYSWNVAGLRAILKKDNFKEFLTKENPDILCLNETKIDDDLILKNNFDQILGKDYLAYFNCCKIKKGYSGTAIFTRYKPIQVSYGIGIQKHDGEGRVINMEFEDFYLIATYIPNAGEGLKRLSYRVDEWDKDFQNYLNKLKLTKHVVWIGDTNVCHKEIDIANPKGNLKSAGFTIEERTSFDNFLNSGYIDTWRKRNEDVVKYSYWSMMGNAREKNKGWRLDYTIVDEEGNNYVKESEILTEYKGSDHCPIKIVWQKNK